MGFVEAIKTCFSKYATFSGRARRPEYWWFFLFTFILGLIPVVGVISGLVCLIPSLAVSWRRMHDIGKPGYASLLGLAGLAVAAVFFGIGNAISPEAGQIGLGIGVIGVLICGVVVIVWLASPTKAGANQYGPEPGKEVDVDGVFE